MAKLTESLYKDCTIEKVTKGQERQNFHCIHLSVPNEKATIVISIQNSFDNIMNQLREMKEGKRNKCYFAKGFTNIDIVKDVHKEELYIVESLQDHTSSAYHLKSLNEIEALIQNIENL